MFALPCRCAVSCGGRLGEKTKNFMDLMLFAAGLDLTTGAFSLLILCVLAVCFFEFVNGFHDTANAVATVIYTHSLKPTQAVVLSGVLNFLGVLLGGLGVAMGIIKLLPMTDLMYAPLSTNVAFMLAVLMASIAWNLGTWYLGLPASSSHTLIGALLGASLMFGAFSAEQTQKTYDIMLFLLITPLIGFFGALLLLWLMRSIIKTGNLYEKPLGYAPPPFWIRVLIIFGCVGISFNHGSNDGQKGVGLLMVVLIAFMPAYYALTPDFNAQACENALDTLAKNIRYEPKTGETPSQEYTKFLADIQVAKDLLQKLKNGDESRETKIDFRRQIRTVFLADVKGMIAQEVADEKAGKTAPHTAAQRAAILEEVKMFRVHTDFAPVWTILIISICLGIGTMIGWKRIVETIGEKIGKSGFDYSQGFIAQLVSTGTIGFSTMLNLPVSTTHIVSSSVMGTMFAKGGRENIQRKTITNILLAWGLTLPVSIGLSAGLYWLFMQFT